MESVSHTVAALACLLVNMVCAVLPLPQRSKRNPEEWHCCRTIKRFTVVSGSHCGPRGLRNLQRQILAGVRYQQNVSRHPRLTTAEVCCFRFPNHSSSTNKEPLKPSPPEVAVFVKPTSALPTT